MSLSPDDHRRRILINAFQMPSVQTMVSRKSSITNAFVSAIIPVIPPTHHEIEEALRILGISPDSPRCAYCGDKASEWDHLRPLVLRRRPTGYVSEIANLVPSCGKCNQSKGNKPWRGWVLGQGQRMPPLRKAEQDGGGIVRRGAAEDGGTAGGIEGRREAWGEEWAGCVARADVLG